MGILEDAYLAAEQIALAKSLIPNLAALHPDTKFQVYREFIGAKNVVELTIFYREPGKEKMRVDAEFDQGAFEEELSPDKIRITRWGSAVKI